MIPQETGGCSAEEPTFGNSIGLRQPNTITSKTVTTRQGGPPNLSLGLLALGTHQKFMFALRLSLPYHLHASTHFSLTTLLLVFYYFLLT